jgi:C_GCAxxG_C_C family probable redox protein
MTVPLNEIAKNDPRLLRPLTAFAEMKLHCSQAVLLPYIEQYPPDVQELILDYTGDLGGGVADLGYVCGGLLGGVMALGRGLKERGVPQKEHEQKIDALIRDFNTRYSSPFCSGITGRDRGTETAYERCRFLVVDVIEAVDKILAEVDQTQVDKIEK